MAAIKQTPRQRLVNMMYLVLIGLLALNVSSEVLNAFQTVTDSLENTSSSFAITADNTMGAFAASMEKDPAKTKPFYDKAQQAQQYIGELDGFIEEIKKKIKERVGVDEESGELKKPGDLDAVNQILLNPPRRPTATELKEMIQETRQKLLDLVPEGDRDKISLALDARDPAKGGKNWEFSMFESVPATAGLTLLAKLQTDAKNAEVEITKYLLTAIDAQDYKFDQLEAAVVAPSSYVLTGEPYEAEIFLTASSSTLKPDVMVNGAKVPVKGNKAIYQATQNQPGMYEYKGVIRVQGAGGEFEQYPFEQSYQVSAPTAVVSPDKMNVLYIGVDNPLSISVPGAVSDEIQASISSGSLSGSGGKYTARVSQAGEATVSVSAEVNGEMRTVGTQKFRVKHVPPPIPKFGGISSGSLNASAARVQPGVFADLENFDFDLKFTVTRFTMILVRRGRDPFVQTSNSAALTDQMKQALGTLSSGDMIAIDDIYAKGPDGTSRKLQSGISIRVQ